MKGKHVFLRWSIFATLVACAAVALATTGVFGRMWREDTTHATTVIMGVFVLVTFWFGRMYWRLANGANPEVLDDDLGHGWFASSICVTIGLLGMVAGVHGMFDAHSGTQAGQLAEQLKHTLGRATITTLVGGICGALLEVQTHFLGQAIKKAARANGKPLAGDKP